MLGPVFSSSFDRPRVTHGLIAANVAVLILMYLTPLGSLIYGLGVMKVPSVMDGQVWRMFTATYMHAGGWHIFANMLGLYFLGPALEEMWGGKKFFIVYTVCGLAGFVLLIPASMIGFMNPAIPALGASGCVLGLLGAMAVLRPNDIIILTIFPMRIKTAAIVLTEWYVFNVISQGQNYGGDLCHLAGLDIGVLWAKQEDKVYY